MSNVTKEQAEHLFDAAFQWSRMLQGHVFDGRDVARTLTAQFFDGLPINLNAVDGAARLAPAIQQARQEIIRAFIEAAPNLACKSVQKRLAAQWGFVHPDAGAAPEKGGEQEPVAVVRTLVNTVMLDTTGLKKHWQDLPDGTKLYAAHPAAAKEPGVTADMLTVLDEACEAMELHGWHDVHEYKKLKALHAALTAVGQVS